MSIDIERLKTDAAYWDEVDVTKGKATHYCTQGGGFCSPDYIRHCDIPRPTKPASPEWDGDEPDAYMCPAGCGCLWRDNGNDTMSLYGPRSQSCDVCEPLPLDRLIPVKKLRTKERRERDDLLEILYMDEPLEVRADAIIAAGWRKGDS